MTQAQRLRELVGQAYDRGLTLDLATAVYGPDTGNDRGFLDTMSYYPLLAGVVDLTGSRTVVEIGTHFGGSTLALLAGLRAAGDDGLLVTLDVTDLNRERLEAEPEIVKVIGDSTRAGFVESLAAELPDGRRVDLLYVDALKDAGYVLTTLHNVHRAGMRPRWVILDDIAANDSMRSLWTLLAREEPEAVYLLSDDRPDIRDPKYGYAILDLDATSDLAGRVPELFAALDLDASHLDTTRPGERYAALRALDAPRYLDRVPDAPRAGTPVATLDLLHELARTHSAPHGDVVAFGSSGPAARALAEGLAANATVADPRRRLHVYRAPERETIDDFHAAVSPRSDLVNAYDVDLFVAGWCGRTISLAVADGVKTPRGFAQLLAAFSPSMMVGTSVLVSTDALAPYRTYQAYVLAYLADHFEVLHQVGLAVVLAHTRAVPADVVARVVENRFTAAERVDLVHAHARTLEGPVRVGFLAHAVRLALRAQDHPRASALMDELDELPTPDATADRTRVEQLREKVSEAVGA